jgi:MEMO1 family protein
MLNKIFSGNNQQAKPANRQPCVAGQFYPGTAAALHHEVKRLLENALPKENRNPLAIISPHAGYVYSGQVAATAFNQIDKNKTYKRIFLIGSSHRTHFDGASVYNRGNYLTPAGEVTVDTALAGKLIAEHACFSFSAEADLQEHSLEVQLPFLQFQLGKKITLVPIVIATQSLQTIEKISAALAPFFNSENLFVISTDFSHYPPYDPACEVDQQTADAIVSNDPATFLSGIKKSESRNIPNLATAICGWTSVLTLLNITSKMQGIEITPLAYKNSGDAEFGSKDQVVGYWAMAVYKNAHHKTDESALTERDKKQLLGIARDAISVHVGQGARRTADPSNISETLQQPSGAFVSVYVEGQLRGCVGRFEPEEPLHAAVADLAISAATDDPRFSPVGMDELAGLSVEISVLTPLKKIRAVSEIEPGKHGIYIKKDRQTGTLLPQVAKENNWSREEFLGYCARDKAKIGWDGWKDAEIFIYEAVIFGDKGTV